MSNEITKGHAYVIRTAAPVSAQFIGRTITITKVLPNAIFGMVDGHGGAILHRAWGTKRNPGDLVLEVA